MIIVDSGQPPEESTYQSKDKQMKQSIFSKVMKISEQQTPYGAPTITSPLSIKDWFQSEVVIAKPATKVNTTSTGP